MAKYMKGSIDNVASDAYIASAIDMHYERCRTDGVVPTLYVNESNGAQALPLLAERNIMARFCYIRSTHFENKQGGSAIYDLPSDFLLSCAMGESVLVIDYGTRKDRSRAVYQGVPFIKYCLDRIWFGYDPDKVIIYPRSNTREYGHNAKEPFAIWFDRIGAKATRRIEQYTDIARENLLETSGGVRLDGISAATTHDGDRLFYANLKRDYFRAMQGKLIV